ncbi:hypothetical protein [Halomonas daqiaonensis]|uniref:Uncharacterized protein n=1 Tax=Halomonas daqiaonensis TaxID=650850 RepID=A0A1H7FXU3_9GAMM|nr:hypothetical protein [Halomonas daqiaonensis]SEK30728.1 hypothetical protein SAMN04488129_101231 [Halomonas daqiaonensis]
MDEKNLVSGYRRWLTFQQQARLDREHHGARQRLEESKVSSTRMTEAYRSMAAKAASEGASYRTLFLRDHDDTALACEGWLFVRRVLAEGGSTRVRATLLTTFTLEEGRIEPGSQPAEKVTLEIFDQLNIDRGMSSVVRVDRIDGNRDTRFITLLDAVRGDLRRHMQ